MRTGSVLIPRRNRKGVHRAELSADRVLVEGELGAQRLVDPDQRAADDVRVPAQVLRERVQHDVGAELERALQVGRCEGVVDDREHAPRARERREPLEVADREQRVRGRLEEQVARRRPEARARRRPRRSRARS
jgi:hypothetical protein